MGTRAYILVTGSDNSRGSMVRPTTTRIYKNSDGYPSGVLKVIRDAIVLSRKQTETQAKRFNETPRYNYRQGQLVGNVLGADVSVYGMGCYIANEVEEPLAPKHFKGMGGAIEWIYVLNMDKGEVTIHRGGYKGHSASDKMQDIDVNDPLEYAEALYQEYKSGERAKINKLIKAIEKMGFKVARPKVKKG